METGNVDGREVPGGGTADPAPDSDLVARLLAGAFETPIPDAVFARVRQALSEQVQLRREDGDDTDDLDAEFTDMLAGAFDDDADLDTGLDRPGAGRTHPLGSSPAEENVGDDLEDGLGDGCPSGRGH